MSKETTKNKGLMTRLSNEKGSSETGVGLGLLAATVGTLVIGGRELAKVLPDTPDQTAKKEATAFNTNITAGIPMRVLENGSAHVQLENHRDRYANIVNPIVTKDGHVIGRDKLTGKVIVFYKDKQASTKEKYAAHDITYTENGKQVSKDQAIEDSKPLVIEIPQKVGNSNEFAYVAANGQGFSGEPIAVDTPEHAITIEKIVPDDQG